MKASKSKIEQDRYLWGLPFRGIGHPGRLRGPDLQRAKAPGNVLLLKGEGNLKKDSVVNISQVITVNKSDLVEKIGSLPAGRLREIVEGFRLLIEPREV